LGYEQLAKFVNEQLEKNEKERDLPPPGITLGKSPDDFVSFVRFMEGKFSNPVSGEPSTREEIADHFMKFFDVDLRGFHDYKTLELTSNGSNFAEGLQEAIKNNRKELEDEQKDIEYDVDEEDGTGN
jgi:hypothetical protein